VPRQSIGIQLYSLRDLAGADLPDVLKTLQEIGYPEVELFQLHGRTAPELRALLDAHSLRALAAHVGINRWRAERDLTGRRPRKLSGPGEAGQDRDSDD